MKLESAQRHRTVQLAVEFSAAAMQIPEPVHGLLSTDREISTNVLVSG